jgi:hypothetical protein
VQDRRSEDLRVLNAALLCQHACNGKRVIDIWRARMILPSLMAMLISGERSGSQY